MDILYIVMPAYNEEANIEKVVREWAAQLEGKDPASRLVVADAGSTDHTHEILEGLKKELTQLEILGDTEKQHGPKLMSLYSYACKSGADYVFQTDSDGQTDPEEFEAFWRKRRKYEALIGRRPVRGDGASRAMVEKVVCLLLFFIFGVKVPDANAPFRLMRSSLLERYLDRLPDDYAIPNIMFTAYFAFYRENIAFRAISFKERSGGENSINIPKIFVMGVRALKEFAVFRSKMKRPRG